MADRAAIDTKTISRLYDGACYTIAADGHGLRCSACIIICEIDIAGEYGAAFEQYNVAGLEINSI